MLGKVRCLGPRPLSAEKDLRSPKENFSRSPLRSRQGEIDASNQELPGLNHLFQTSTTGAPSEYAQIEETIAPSALALIGD